MYKTKQSKPTSKSAVYMGDWGLEENMIPLEKKVLYKHQSTCHYLFQPWLQWNTEKSFLLFLVKCFFPSHFLSCMLSIHKLHIIWKQAPCLCWSYVIINKYDSQSNHNVCKLAYELITNYIWCIAYYFPRKIHLNLSQLELLIQVGCLYCVLSDYQVWAQSITFVTPLLSPWSLCLR